MNLEQRSPNEVSIGYLVVKVSTARGAIPLENAAVSIRGGTPESSGIIYSLRSNSDGITEKIALPTPSPSFSASPGNPTPYSTWNIDVFKDGYAPISFTGVPVYPAVVSVQPAVMIPLTQGFIYSESFNESEGPNL